MSVVAMDCEMVGSGNRSLLARVSIVDQHGSVLLDEYVQPTAIVTDYRTSISGIKKEHLVKARCFNDVRREVMKLIDSKVLVGHSLHFDLDALELSSLPEINQRDLAKYGPYMKNGQPQSLQILAQKHLNKHIQDGEHDSVKDAQTAMQLYKLVASHWRFQ